MSETQHALKRIGQDTEGPTLRVMLGDETGRGVVDVWNFDNDQEKLDSLARLIAAAPYFRQSAKALKAWQIAERDSIGSFNDRCDLCGFAEWTADAALAKSEGREFDEPFRGITRFYVGPGLSHATASAEVDVMAEFVDSILSGNKDASLAAITKARGEEQPECTCDAGERPWNDCPMHPDGEA